MRRIQGIRQQQRSFQRGDPTRQSRTRIKNNEIVIEPSFFSHERLSIRENPPESRRTGSRDRTRDRPNAGHSNGDRILLTNIEESLTSQKRPLGSPDTASTQLERMLSIVSCQVSIIIDRHQCQLQQQEQEQEQQQQQQQQQQRE